MEPSIFQFIKRYSWRQQLVILALSVLILGLWPAPLIEMMEPTLDNFVIHVTHSKLGG